ncbi:MAG TPA: hypothetical protein VFE03_14510 [Caulobacteraceae bacterium]|jgi:hypothetical protein|nr:hypothetical protein [Caulobacteraceae bacterium]
MKRGIALGVAVIAWATFAAGLSVVETAFAASRAVKPAVDAYRRTPGGVHTKPPPIAATSTLECSGKRYEVSVSGGNCTKLNDTMTCSNEKGDHAFASCTKGCGDTTSGSGSCTVKQ